MVRSTGPKTAMDEVQRALRPLFTREAFRVNGRTFNRRTADGLTQVIDFQMGRFDPPGTYEIPGFRDNLYGKFTVNVGVFVPEVQEGYLQRPIPAFVRELECCIRKRLGQLGPDGQDVWWNLGTESSPVADVEARLDRYALPYLARFETREAILREVGEASERMWTGPPPRIVTAVILAGRGELTAARERLSAEARESPMPTRVEYLRAAAKRLGVEPLDL